MISVSEHRVERTAGSFLHFHLRSAQSGSARPVVVFSHGFITNGLENHGMFMRIARTFGHAGFSSLLVDFYGTGYSDGDYVDFQLSEAGKDLAMAAEWASKKATCDGTVVLFGQSLGTAACSIAVQSIGVPVVAMVLWNLSGDFETRYPRLFGEKILGGERFCVPRKGYLVGPDFLDDAARFDVLELLAGRTEPTLFVSCTGDSMSDETLTSYAIDKMAGACRKIEYPDANHSFWCQPDEEERATRESLRWLEAVLGKGL